MEKSSDIATSEKATEPTQGNEEATEPPVTGLKPSSKRSQVEKEKRNKKRKLKNAASSEHPKEIEKSNKKTAPTEPTKKSKHEEVPPAPEQSPEEKREALGMTELDKFKRRMIRSVAGMLIYQKMPENQVWDEMKKIMGYDCKILWDRMKSLTVKKLKRLLAADDRTENIPVVARMTLTDWQLYDQILVHEEVDVIGLDTISAAKSDSKVLIDLFGLVQRFDIEMTIGDSLTEAWTDATLYYNSNGHQCSPMLLQKRWHQLKSETRRRFYKYWNSYRGTKRLLPNAEPYKPTILMRAVAKRFPEVITHKFPDWETSIRDSLVILPDDFQRIKWNRGSKFKKPGNKSTPDLLVIEPVIETIDLLQESDTEQEVNPAKTGDSSKEDDAVTRVKIKVELDDDFSTVAQKQSKTSKVMAHLQEQETLFDNINADIDSLKAAENNLIHLAVGYESKLKDVEIEIEPHTKDSLENVPKITNVFGNAPMTDATLTMIENLAKKHTNNKEKEGDTVVVQEGDKDKTDADDVNSSVAIDVDTSDGESDTDLIKTTVGHVKSETNDDVIKTSDATDNDNDDAIITKLESDSNQTTVSNLSQLNQGAIDLSSFGEIPDNLNFADDGVELMDDSVDYTDNSLDYRDIKMNVMETAEDVKILDYMEEPKVKIEKDEYDNNVEIKIEKTDTMMDASKNPNETQEFKFDEKLFLDPVVYTQKLEDMNVLQNKEFTSVNDQTLIKKIIDESKPISDRSVDAEKKKIDRQRVSITSYLFKKPKHRNYNPIQLCKNPDFNTRLKRLTAGFLSSSRNRSYLKVCLPLTIDLTKAFEPKLINNTVYLKKPHNTSIIKIEDDEAKTVSMMPSANPLQSIIDNAPANDKIEYKNPSTTQATTSTSENNVGRYKAIHLPDIIQIRRINQTLLTAEISPMPMRKTSSYCQSPDLSSNESSNQNDFEESNLKVNNDPSLIRSANFDHNTNIKVYTHTSMIAPESTKGSVANKEDVIDITGRAKNPSMLSQLWQHKNYESIDASLNNQLNKPDTNDTMPIQNTDDKQPKTKKPQRATWRPQFTKPQYPLYWRKFTNKEPNIDEFLLTKDTLDKMLSLFSGKALEDQKKKQKYQPRVVRPIARTDSSKEIQAKRGNISQDVPPPLIPIIRKNMSELEKTTRQRRGKRLQSTPNLITKVCSGDKTRYCCWARERIVSKNKTHHRVSEHNCPDFNCTCCCAKELKTSIKSKFWLSKHLKTKPSETKVAEAHTNVDESEVEPKTNTEDVVVSENDKAKENTITSPAIAEDSSKTNVVDGNTVKSVLAETSIAISMITEEKLPEVYTVTSQIAEIVNTDIDVAETVVEDNVLTQLSPLEDITVPTISNVYSLNSELDTGKVNRPYLTICTNSSAAVDPSAPVANIIVTTSKPDFPPVQNTPIPKVVRRTNKKNKAMSKIIEKQNQGSIRVTSGPRNKGKVLVLNEEKKNNSCTSPIYLGRNKILLTNITFPDHMNESHKATHVPKGVQMLLLSDGKIKYLAQNEDQTSSENAASFTPVLSTIQQPLCSLSDNSVTSISTADVEVVELSDDETYSVQETSGSAEVIYNMFHDDKQNKETNVNKSLGSEEKVRETNVAGPTIAVDGSEANIEIPESSNANLSDNVTDKCSEEIKDTAKITVNENTEEITKINNQAHVIVDSITDKKVFNAENTNITDESVNNKESTDETVPSKKDVTANVELSNTKSIAEKEINKKTILSDLMEMSGISAEDAVPVHVFNNPIPTNPERNLHNPPPPVITVCSPNNTIAPSTVDQTDDSVRLLHKLSTVTTFTQLKYACEKGGFFFKLDFQTGAISPIQISFQKGRRPVESKKNIRIAPKVTIDLTDEIEPMTNNQAALSMESTMLQRPVNPVTIFKPIQRPRILRKVGKNSIPSKVQLYTPKFMKNKNESLLYHFRVPPNVISTPNPKRKAAHDVQVLSESSDEEPLSEKAKRKRADQSEETGNNSLQVNEVTEKGSMLTMQCNQLLEQNRSVEHEAEVELTVSIQDDNQIVGISVHKKKQLLEDSTLNNDANQLLQIKIPVEGEKTQIHNTLSEVTPIPGSLTMSEDDSATLLELSPNEEDDCILGV